MYGDFSRDSFDPNKHYTRVLMQQGRPLTDADWNEMVESLVCAQRELVKSVIGWHGSSDLGFELLGAAGKYKLHAGTYYVDGMLFRNECTSSDIPTLTLEKPNDFHLIYLDTWEESVNSADDIGLLEPALNGIETSTRTRLSWAVRVSESELKVDPSTNRDTLLQAVTGTANVYAELPELEVTVQSTARNSSSATSPACEVADIARQGQELLYRIEIHNRGTPVSPSDANALGTATFKWSRDNGDTVIPLKPVSAGATRLFFADSIGAASRQRRERLRKSAWVELIDEWGASRSLLKIKEVGESFITVESVPSDIDRKILARSTPVRSYSSGIRQWDHNAKEDNKVAAVPAKNFSNDGWIEIENGLKVRFPDNGYYLDGDYWLIRLTADGQFLVSDPSEVVADFGRAKISIGRRRHHFAPLGTMKFANQAFEVATPYRKRFTVSGIPDPDRWNNDPCPTAAPAPPAAAPAAPAAVPAPAGGGLCSVPVEARLTVNPVSLLSGEGARALKGYLASPKDVTRRVPARYLSYEPQSEVYRRFRSPLLVSEILETSYEKYLAKVERCVEVSEAERALVEADARADYALAAEFQSLVSSGQGFRPLIA